MARWLLIGLWLVVILLNSSVPMMPSRGPSPLVYLQAKVGHVLEYSILGWMLATALISPRGGVGLGPRAALLLILLLGVPFAAFDEARQLFVYSRTGNPVDVALDMVSLFGGALLGARGWGMSFGGRMAAARVDPDPLPTDERSSPSVEP